MKLLFATQPPTANVFAPRGEFQGKHIENAFAHVQWTMYHVAEWWPRLRFSVNLSNQRPRMFNPPPMLAHCSFARKRANFIHGTRYMVHGTSSQEPFLTQKPRRFRNLPCSCFAIPRASALTSYMVHGTWYMVHPKWSMVHRYMVHLWQTHSQCVCPAALAGVS